MKIKALAITPALLLLCSGVLMAAMFLPSMALAQTWEVMGPDGGSFLGSVTDPANADLITAVTAYPSASAAFGTTDGAQTWTKKGDIPNDYLLHDFCAYDASILYVVSRYACYKSTDGGVTWVCKPIPASVGWARAICVHPTDPDKIHVAGYRFASGKYNLVAIRSSDGGDTWTKIILSNSYALPQDIDICESNPDVLYMCGYGQIGGGDGGFMFRSEDGGDSWYDISTAVEPTPLNNKLYCVAIDPTNENNVYAGGKAAYRTTDGGATWTKDTSQTFNLEVLGVDPVNSANVYGASTTAAYVSHDSARTWTKHGGAVAGSPAHVEVAPALHFTVYISSTSGLYKTADTGATWGAAHGGSYTVTIPSIAVAPSQPEMVIADVAGFSRLIGSQDCGDSWGDLVYPEGCGGTIIDLLINSDDPNTIIALETG